MIAVAFIAEGSFGGEFGRQREVETFQPRDFVFLFYACKGRESSATTPIDTPAMRIGAAAAQSSVATRPLKVLPVGDIAAPGSGCAGSAMMQDASSSRARVAHAKRPDQGAGGQAGPRGRLPVAMRQALVTVVVVVARSRRRMLSKAGSRGENLLSQCPGFQPAATDTQVAQAGK